jgi:hypothetical protein
MRKIREITSEKENFRLEPFAPNAVIVKRDPIEPEPIGTIVLLPFKITGYDKDCDGSLMARLANIELDSLEETGWEESNIGLYPEDGFVVTEKELEELIKSGK